jgi:polysaccharide deacetylase 2 family uncharacterized protein YibQ
MGMFYLYGISSAFKYIYSTDSNKNIASHPEREGKLAIIIDDFGQNRDGVSEMMSIDRHLTFAIMPFLTFSKSDAQNAHEKGYEVIAHLPMEATAGKLSWVGPRPILTGMREEDIKHLVEDAFDNIPYMVGANIHMGSKAGEDEKVMSAILEVVKQENLYFVDSRSCEHPIGKRIADSKGVLCYERNIFLDGKKTKSYIKRQLHKAGDIALEKGRCVAIGHVGTEGGRITAEAINEMLEELDDINVRLVFISELDK